MHGEVIVDCARLVDDMHHFERPYLKTALIDVVMSLSLHHAQAQDLYEEKRSHESLAEKRRKTRVKLELECAAAWRGGSHYG